MLSMAVSFFLAGNLLFSFESEESTKTTFLETSEPALNISDWFPKFPRLTEELTYRSCV